MAKATLFAAFKALLVRLVYAVNGIVLTFFVHDITKENRVFLINALLIPSAIEVAITLKYKKKGEWTWFIPSVFIYLLWVVPCIIYLEVASLNFRTHIVNTTGISYCPISFNDECRAVVLDEEHTIDGTSNVTDHLLTPASHDMSRRYSMLSQQIMMLIIIFGRWMAPKGKLSRDQLSSLLLALTAMALDMLEFSTDSLSIEAVSCDKVYVGFIIGVWCWSLLQIPLGLTAVKQRKPRVAGQISSRDSSDGSSRIEHAKGNGFDWKAYCCCCCESEIWSLTVSIFMQDGPYLILRLYIMFSTGYIGETLIFFAAKNALIVMLQTYRVIVKVNETVKKRHERKSFKGRSDLPAGLENGDLQGQGPSDAIDDADSVVVTISPEESDDGGAASQGENALRHEECSLNLEQSEGGEVPNKEVSADGGFQNVSLDISDEALPSTQQNVHEEQNDNEN